MSSLRTRSLFPVGICALLLVASVLPTNAGPRPVPRAPRDTPVVIIAFDELPLVSLLDREGAIDQRLFPNFAELAAATTWYPNTTTTATFTHDALPAILTGREPLEGARWFPGGPGSSIFTLLDESHSILSPEPYPLLCDPLDCRREAARAPELPSVATFIEGLRSAPLVSFFSGLEDVPKKPCLCVLHVVMPHSPWVYLADGTKYGNIEPVPGEYNPPGPGRSWTEDRWLVGQAYQRHLMQASFTDRILGAVVDRLKSLPWYDDALVFVTADHGISFTPGTSKRGIMARSAGQLAAVPLFVKSPGQTSGAIDPRRTRSTDIVPTILRKLKVETAADFDGRPLSHRGPLPTPSIDDVALSRMHRRVERSVARKFGIFPAVGTSPALYAIAPPGTEDLLGTRAPDVLVGQLSAELPALEHAALPPMIMGTLLGAGGSGQMEIGLAVDGVIVAVTRTYRYASGQHFYAMVPPEALAGGGTLRLFKVEGDRVLEEIPTRSI